MARRRAILDRCCARRPIARAGRDGRMAPIEQKDWTEERQSLNTWPKSPTRFHEEAINNARRRKIALRRSHLHLAADITRGDLSEREYKSARAMDLLSAKTRGMDAYMNQHKLDAVLFAGSTGAAIAAKAGY